MQRMREVKLAHDETTQQFNNDRERLEQLLGLEVKKVAAAELSLRRVTAALSSDDPQAALIKQIQDSAAAADDAIAEVDANDDCS